MSDRLENSIRFGFLIHDISRLRRVVIDRALKPLRITRSQWWMLAILSRRDGINQTALAHQLEVSKVAVGGLLQRMEASGLISRSTDLRDARIRRVYLTPDGHAMVRRMRRHVEAIEMEILGPSPPADLQTAVEVLRSMKEMLIAIVSREEPGHRQGD